MVRAALDDTGPLEPAIEALASMVADEDALDLAADLTMCAGKEATALPWWFEPKPHDRSDAQIRSAGAEGSRRQARVILLAHGVLQAQAAAIAPLLRHAVRGMSGHSTLARGPAHFFAVAWLVLEGLGGERAPLPEAFWSTMKHVMGIVELEPAISDLLRRTPEADRIAALQVLSNTARDSGVAWLYARTLPAAAMPKLVNTYAMRPDERYFLEALERMRAEGLLAERDEVLAWASYLFGKPPMVQWSIPDGIQPRTFENAAGEPVTVYVCLEPASVVLRPVSWPRAVPA